MNKYVMLATLTAPLGDSRDQLPADRQELLRREWFLQLPEDRRKALREKWQSLTPEQRQRFREQRMNRWQQQDEGG